MRGIRIDFKKTGSTFNFDTLIEDSGALVQNSMVNVGTAKGTDVTYPEKGTTLLSRAVSGVLINEGAVENEAKFAAVDTLFFSRETTNPNFDTFIEEFTLRVAEYNINNAKLQPRFTMGDGEVIGNLTELST